MATFEFTKFGGMAPLYGEQKRPPEVATLAIDCDLESMDLEPIRAGIQLTTVPTGTVAAFRIPAALRGDITDPVPSSVYDTNDFWKSFSHSPYTQFLKGPLVNDKYDRWYWTQEGQSPQYNSFERIKGGHRDWELGVPKPDAPTDEDGYGNGPAARITVTPETTPPDPPLTVHSGEDGWSTTPGRVDISYLRHIMVHGGLPGYFYKVSAGVLPPGVSLDPVTGGVSGIPTAAGVYSVTFEITDEEGTVVTFTTTITIYVTPYTGAINVVVLEVTPPSATANWYYAHSIPGEGGTAPLTMQVVRGGLPPGLTMGYDGFVSGTPTNSGSYSFTVQAADADGAVDTWDISIYVYNDPIPEPPKLLFETRCYVYTLVTEWGEEGPPSDPVCADGATEKNWTIGVPLTAFSHSRWSTAHITKKKIYRTVTGVQGGSFFFVAEVDLATTSYVDSAASSDIALNNQLESDTWFPPPPDLVGLSAHPNGFFVAYDPIKNDVLFSEPYRPHAWPVAYTLSIPSNIIGISVFAGQVLILTSANPYTATGAIPAAMSLIKNQTSDPCLSPYGIIGVNNGVIYTSRNGLMIASGADLQSLTKQILSERDWLEYNPETLIGAQHKDQLVFLSGTGHSFLFDPSQENAIWTRISKASLSKFLRTDLYTSDAYYISGTAVQSFSSANGAYQPYSWESSEFSFKKPVNLGVVEIIIVDPLRELRPVTLILNDVRHGERYRVTTNRSGTLRLPCGYKSDRYTIRLEGSARVSKVRFAETGLGLAEV